MAEQVGYKYVRGTVDETQVNWAEVGSNLSTGINKIKEDRDSQKAAIDQATREYQEKLNDVPIGGYDKLSEKALKYADDLQKTMLIQEQLLKSGQLSPKDYTIMRQNLTDGTKEGFAIFEEYNAEYENIMKLNKDNVLSEIDLKLLGDLEGFGNFNKYEFVINPSTGNVSVAEIIEDPNNPGQFIPNMNPNKMQSVQALKKRIKERILKYDVLSKTTTYSSSLGDNVVEGIKKNGGAYSATIFESDTDIKQRLGGLEDMTDIEKAKLAEELGVDVSALKGISLFDQAVDTWAESELGADNMAAATVLVDFMDKTTDGKEYEVTYNEAETLDANGKRLNNVILLKNENGMRVVDLTDEQKEEAKRALKTQVLMQLDVKHEERAERTGWEPNVNLMEFYEKKEEEREAPDLWNKIYGATSDAERQNLIHAIVSSPSGKAAGLKGITIGDDGYVRFRYNTPEKNRDTEPVYVGKNPTEEQWARVATEITNKGVYLDGFTGKYNPIKSGGYTADRDENQTVDYNVELRNDIESNLVNFSKNDDEKTFIKKHGNYIRSLGFNIEEAVGGVDAVLITPVGGKEEEGITIKLKAAGTTPASIAGALNIRIPSGVKKDILNNSKGGGFNVQPKGSGMGNY